MKELGFPMPLWYLMEIIVDPTLNDPAVCKHTLYENRAYEEFYISQNDKKSPIERLKQIYEGRSDVKDLLLRGYELAEEYAKSKLI